MTEKKAIELNITIDIDPTLNGEKGALNQFGQDISTIMKYGSPTIHLSAWTPLPAAVDTPEYQTLLANLSFTRYGRPIHAINPKAPKTTRLPTWSSGSPFRNISQPMLLTAVAGVTKNPKNSRITL